MRDGSHYLSGMSWLCKAHTCVFNITVRAAADKPRTAAGHPTSPHTRYFCGMAGSWGHRVGYTLNIVRFKGNSVNDINFKIQTNFHTLLSLLNVVHRNVQILRCKEAYMNSVSLMCQGRKPSVLFTGPNFTTNSGSGIFFDSETSTKKANMLSRQSFFSYLLRICMFWL